MRQRYKSTFQCYVQQEPQQDRHRRVLQQNFAAPHRRVLQQEPQQNAADPPPTHDTNAPLYYAYSYKNTELQRNTTYRIPQRSPTHYRSTTKYHSKTLNTVDPLRVLQQYYTVLQQSSTNTMGSPRTTAILRRRSAIRENIPAKLRTIHYQTWHHTAPHVLQQYFEDNVGHEIQYNAELKRILQIRNVNPPHVRRTTAILKK